MQADTYSADYVSDGHFIEMGAHGSYSYSNTGSDSGTVIHSYDDGSYGGACAIRLVFLSQSTGTLSYICDSGIQGQQESWYLSAISELGAPVVVPRAGTNTELQVSFQDVIGDGETKAYDFQLRIKAPQGTWIERCSTVSNTSGRRATATITVGFINLELETAYEVRYRSRNSSRCGDGSPGGWSQIGEGATSSGGSSPISATFRVGDVIQDFPSGFSALSGNFRNGVEISASGGAVTVTMSNGGTAEYSHATYTCTSAGGCKIENGRVTRGTVTAS